MFQSEDPTSEVSQGKDRGLTGLTPTTTPKEILMAEVGKFKPPPPMTEVPQRKYSTRTASNGSDWKQEPNGDAEHSTKAWMNFMIVRSLSSYNGIIGRPKIREIQAVPSTAHEMLKFSVDRGIVTIRSTILIPTECATMTTASKEILKEAEVRHENFKIALHPNFPDQEVAIEGTLSAKGRTKLCLLLKEKLDIFA
uniref:Reverse transcriptase domain-containing protein n=1 Tax=Tanacetum cinerariifolium TaxID=118510 RepID=A0A699HXL0_TANCI|nr:reverse transcriptase domain-containing protein [Tanacetum cinerariifolium]